MRVATLQQNQAGEKLVVSSLRDHYVLRLLQHTSKLAVILSKGEDGIVKTGNAVGASQSIEYEF